MPTKLTRKIKQTVQIGDHITIIVAGISQDQVQLTISAPLSLPVYPGEIYEEIKAEQQLGR